MLRYRWFLFASLAVLLLVLVGLNWPREGSSYLTQLKSRVEYNNFKGPPLSNKYSQMESLKVVYDLRRKKLYFINSTRYKYHYFFCQMVLGNRQDNHEFNQRNYTDTTHRQYLLGNLNYFRPLQQYLLEFSVADNISAHQVADLHAALIKHSFLNPTELAVLLHTENLRKRFESSGIQLPHFTPQEIYVGQQYQAVQKGECYGYLRKIAPQEAGTVKVQTRDIVWLNGPADALSPAAGVISSEFQTPLSHLTLLCKNRQTPMLVHRDSGHDSLLQALEGKLIYMKVLQDTFVVREATVEKASKFWEKHQVSTVKLKADLRVTTLVDLENINHKSVKWVGGKAANFGELQHIQVKDGPAIRLPEGAFAIPFYFYQQHLQQHGLDLVLDSILLRYAQNQDRIQLEKELRGVRNAIRSAALDSTFLEMVENRIRENGWLRMRFRSSTNAEDIAGFNGAGLYRSKTGIPGDAKKSVEVAIKRVWASLWRTNAFLEREYFQMDQRTAKMGILVHRSFPDETANGVAITKNLYRDNFYGFVINVQAGESSVVAPDSGITCDQIICYSDNEVAFFNRKQIVEYITRSNLQEQPVLTAAEVVVLTRQLAAIKSHFYNRVFIKKGTYENFGMDVEFKVYGPDRKIYIKQARLFVQ
ncbi:MAG: PEP/pyruvate-binding domain-containing protein [Salibacteraceae bacterium]